MNMEGLQMIGIKRAGTLCLLLKKIKKLEKDSEDFATLIEHSPYCFGKILDYLGDELPKSNVYWNNIYYWLLLDLQCSAYRTVCLLTISQLRKITTEFQVFILNAPVQRQTDTPPHRSSATVAPLCLLMNLCDELWMR